MVIAESPHRSRWLIMIDDLFAQTNMTIR